LVRTDFYQTSALFVWLISHQPAVLFSQNKSATNNQPAVLFSQNISAPAISHQPNEQADQVDHCNTVLSEKDLLSVLLVRAWSTTAKQ
jgi:hypothetical protein